MINHFKTRLGWMPVDGGERTQPDEFLAVFQLAAQIHNLSGIRDERRLAQRLLRLQDGGVVKGVIHLARSFLAAALVTDQSMAPFFHT